MELGLTDKRILVTGASRGIGAAIARSFLKEGAKVCIVSRGSEQLYLTEKKLLAEFNADRILVRECDCGKIESLHALKDSIQAQWGGLDVVIANVGNGRSVSDAIPDDYQWQKTWGNNFDPALYTGRIFLPLLRDSKGCLLFISSITGLESVGAPVDYSTSKAAIIALAKNMSRKLAQEVRVNVVAPGNVWFHGGEWDDKKKTDPERVEKLIETTVPMNRFGTPEEIANAVVFLCSERASFITGSTLVIDGGQTGGVF